jgi:uncharacterized lipoprotein YehR (DUF1307 family)
VIMKKFILATSIILALALAGCGDKKNEVMQPSQTIPGAINTRIAFDNDKVNADDTDGVSVGDKEVKITKAGVYVLSGT